MNKNLKLFTSDQDRLAFEDSNSYERPYVSAVSGDAHFNKLITGTIENPAIGELNVQDGDYFDRISIQKKLTIGGTGNSAYSNIMCFPFDITINELREALLPYKLHYIYFSSEMSCSRKVDNQGNIIWSEGNLSTNSQLKDDNLIIQSGKPFVVQVSVNDSKQILSTTLTFKNKTISIKNSLIQENVPQSDWYFVGTPFKVSATITGLSTASQIMAISNGSIVRGNISTVNMAMCSGWFEYRGPVPSVTE